MGNRVWWIGAAVVIVIGTGVGLYVYATYAMKDRVVALNASIGEIGYARGGRVPDTASFRQEVERLAALYEVELDSLVVVREQGQGLDTAGRLANKRLSAVRGGPVDLPAQTFQMTIVRYHVRARARTNMWVFAGEQEIDTERTFRTSVTLSPAIAPRRELPEHESLGERGL